MSDTVTALIEVDWSIAPISPDPWGNWRRCDLCDGTPIDDFSAEKEARRFFKQVNGPDDGLIVCEHCLDEYLAGDSS